MQELENRIESLPEEEKNAIKKTIEEIYKERPRMYMVDSDKGITNLHMPNDVIIDASVPAVIKTAFRDGALTEKQMTQFSVSQTDHTQQCIRRSLKI